MLLVLFLSSLLEVFVWLSIIQMNRRTQQVKEVEQWRLALALLESDYLYDSLPDMLAESGHLTEFQANWVKMMKWPMVAE